MVFQGASECVDHVPRTRKSPLTHVGDGSRDSTLDYISGKIFSLHL